MPFRLPRYASGSRCPHTHTHTHTSHQEALELRLQPAPTFTATSCPHCDNVFEVAIDFEEIKDHVEFERLKKKELESQKEAYKQEITRFQEEVNSLKETLANLCNQLAQAQVENLRSKQASLEQDNYIKQLKDHLKQSEEELHHLAHDFELALERNKELQNAHVRNTGVMPPVKYVSKTATRITEGAAGPAAVAGGGGGSGPSDSTPTAPAARGGGSVRRLASRYDPPASGGGVAAAALAAAGGSGGGGGARGGGGERTSARDKEMYRQQLLHFYSVHNPSKMGEVDGILDEFAGHEEDMLVMLARKYGAPPLIPAGGSHAASPAAYAGPSRADEDDQLRLVAPWTLQMSQSKSRKR